MFEFLRIHVEVATKVLVVVLLPQGAVAGPEHQLGQHGALQDAEHVVAPARAPEPHHAAHRLESQAHHSVACALCTQPSARHQWSQHRTKLLKAQRATHRWGACELRIGLLLHLQQQRAPQLQAPPLRTPPSAHLVRVN